MLTCGSGNTSKRKKTPSQETQAVRESDTFSIWKTKQKWTVKWLQYKCLLLPSMTVDNFQLWPTIFYTAVQTAVRAIKVQIYKGNIYSSYKNTDFSFKEQDHATH